MFKEGISEFVLVPVFVLLVSIVSILFYWFNISNRKQVPLAGNSVPTKKTKKRKSPALKIDKSNYSDKDDSSDKAKEVRHIEIKESPIMIGDHYRRRTDSDIDTHTIKPILKNADEPIINHENDDSEQFTWNKVPKDEIEIIRSRHSSVVSDAKEEINDVKLTKKQRRRLNAKLKSMENRKSDNDSQGNNSASKGKVEAYGEEPAIEPVNDVLLYNEADVVMETLVSTEFSTQLDDLDDNPNLDKTTTIKDMGIYEDLKIVRELLDERNRENDKLHDTIENLKQTNEQLLQKNRENHQVRTAAMSLEKDNKLLSQKNSELERTVAALRNDMSNSVQKVNSLENQVLRINNEKNQDRNYMKENMERLQCLISKKEQTIQNMNSEMNTYKEQINVQVQELQEMSNSNMTIQSALKDKESINKQLEEKLKTQYAANGRIQNDLEKLQKTHNIVLSDGKKKQEQSDTLISSLQYQIDDLQKERQNFIDFDEIEANLKQENEKLKKQCLALMQKPASVTLENDECKRLLQIINTANLSLEKKCDEFNEMKEAFNQRENELLNLNKILDQKQQQHKTDLATMRQHDDELKSMIGNINSLKEEVTTKTLALEEMELILKNLEFSVEQEHKQYKEKIYELEKLNESLRSTSLVNNDTCA